MRIFLATIITVIVLLPLTGCAKKNQPPTEVKAPAPTKTPTKAPAPASVPTTKPEPSAPVARSSPQASNPIVRAPSSQTPVYFGEVLFTWNTGNKDAAVRQFLQMHWQDSVVFQGIPVLTMLEQQFSALADAQRDPISQQAQQMSTTIRDIAKAAISSGDAAAASGDAAGAKASFEAVQQFGQALAAPEHLLIIQLAGKAAVKLAQDKLPAAQ